MTVVTLINFEFGGVGVKTVYDWFGCPGRHCQSIGQPPHSQHTVNIMVTTPATHIRLVVTGHAKHLTRSSTVAGHAQDPAHGGRAQLTSYSR